MTSQSGQSDIIAEYLRKKNGGEKVDVEALCFIYPEHAEELRSFIAAEELFSPPIQETPTSHLGDVNFNAETIAPGLVVESNKENEETIFGRYHIQRELGHGAMGSVFCAYDTQLDCLVALKIPKRTVFIDEEFRERFKREAQSAAKLSHPNICRLFDFGIIKDTPYISMAFIDGQTLSRFVGTPQYYDQRNLAEIIIEIALALEHAHQKNVIHRDVKPGNVLIDENGTSFITDFGLARKLDQSDESRMTQDGVLLGTPAYMAPEQMKGIHDKVGVQSDIYSLGVILFELLTGEQPFKGTIHEIIAQVARDLPQRPSSLRNDVDGEIEKLCLQMMEKEPEDRPQSMQEVADKLTAWLKNRTAIPQANIQQKENILNQLNAAKESIVQLLEKDQFTEAIEQLSKMASIKNKEAIDHVIWAKTELALTLQKMEGYRESLPDVIINVSQFMSAGRYDQAIPLLKEIPHELRTNQAQNLLDQSIDLKKESEVLTDHIFHALETQQIEDIEPIVNRLLEIKPDNEMARELQASLSTYSEGKKHLFDDKGHLIPSRFESNSLRGIGVIILVVVIVILIVFAAITFIRNSGNQRTVNNQSNSHQQPLDGDRENVIKNNNLASENKKRPVETKPDVSNISDPPEPVSITPSPTPEEKPLPAADHSHYLNPDWIEKRLATVGIFNLINEYFGKGDQDVHTVYQALKLSHDVINLYPQSLRQQLQARLIGFKKPEFEQFQQLPADRVQFRSEWNTFLHPENQPQEKIKVAHHGRIECVAISANGERLVSGSNGGASLGNDFELIVWDKKNGKLLHQLRGHSSKVYCVAVSPDGTRAITGSGHLASNISDYSLMVWDIVKGKLIKTLRGHDYTVTCVGFTPDGQRAVSGSMDGTLRVWDIESGKVLKTLKEQSEDGNWLTLSPNSKFAISSGGKGLLKLWDIKNEKILKSLSYSGHSGKHDTVAMTPDGSLVIYQKKKNEILVWEKSSTRRPWSLVTKSSEINFVMVTPDGRHAIIDCDDKRFNKAGEKNSILEVWNLNSRKLMTTYPLDDPTSHIALGENGQSVIVGSGQIAHSLTLLILKENKTVSKPTTPKTEPTKPVPPDTSTKLKPFYLAGTIDGHSDIVRSIAISPDGTKIVSGSNDHMVKLWNIATRSMYRTFTRHTENVRSVAFSPNGQQIASSGNDNTIVLWNVKTGQRLRTIKGRSSRTRQSINMISYSPHGDKIAGANNDRTVSVWDTKTGALLINLPGHRQIVNAVLFSPDGKTIASCSMDKTIKLWDSKTGKELKSLQGHSDNITSIDFNSDGTKIASASADKTIKLWNVKTGQVLKTFRGHSELVRCVALSFDGKRIVSGSLDKTIKLWDVPSSKLLQTLQGHHQLVTSIAFSPDGKQIISGSFDKTIKIWNANQP